MPKSFLVRKKSCVQTKTWEDVATPVFTPVERNCSHITTPPKDPEDDSPPQEPEEDKGESDASLPKRACKSECNRHDNLQKCGKSDIFQFPNPSLQHQHHEPHPHPEFQHLHPPHHNHNLPYKSHSGLLGRKCHEFPPFPHPLLHPFPPPVLWNPVLHAHPQSPPFLHVHSPPPWLPTPPPTNSPPTATWRSAPPIGKPSSPLGVLSPAEIPSPSSSTVAEEPSSCNSAAIPGFPVHKIDLSRHSDQSKSLLQMPGQCYPAREPIPYVKTTGVNVEVINNGFGIKNPLLASDRTGPGHAEIPTIRPSSGYMMTSESSYTCSLCGFKSDSPRLLQKHLKSHKEIKRFLCTVCGKGFNDTFDLKRHTRTHTGVRPYKCDKCGKAFTQRCSLESHCKKIHGIRFQFAFNERRTKTYVCEDCGHSTNDPEEHFVHLRSQHPNNPAILRCHDRRQFKFSRRRSTSLELEEIRVN